ncbi:MAG: hypothetical protein DMG65_23410 [Candidatus Angelobacter sp. Gp1-AA117]|nr:MAG: hypothetical protein DMG65_23410 [Candidatus Angelobacter sp. Gp1-AA117]
MNLPITAARLVLGVVFVCVSTAQERSPVALQAAIQHAMKGRPGSVVMLNVASGKILAAWNLNVAAQRVEPPGSTVKPFVLLELLESGKIKAEQRLVCHRPLYVGGHRMDCSHPATVTALDAPDAIAYSCNSYFASVATQLTRTELLQVFQRAGFTATTGLAATEATGRLMSPRDQGQVQLQALGEWGVEVTPLELLAAYRNLALKKLRSPDPGNAAPVFDGMERAVKYGIAHGAQPEGTTAAGKTGTASGVNTPVGHGFFVGYAPAEKPEIAVIVYLEHGRGLDAAAIAGPVITAWWRSR